MKLLTNIEVSQNIWIVRSVMAIIMLALGFWILNTSLASAKFSPRDCSFAINCEEMGKEVKQWE